MTRRQRNRILADFYRHPHDPACDGSYEDALARVEQELSDEVAAALERTNMLSPDAVDRHAARIAAEHAPDELHRRLGVPT